MLFELIGRNGSLAGYLGDSEFAKFIAWRIANNAYPYQPPDQAIEMESTGQATAILESKLAELNKAVRDLSGLVCIQCGFTKLLKRSETPSELSCAEADDLANFVELNCVSFAHSVLIKSHFQNMSAIQADFSDAYIASTFFVSSSLRGARMAYSNSKSEHAIQEEEFGRGLPPEPILFYSTDLSGANLSGRQLLGVGLGKRVVSSTPDPIQRPPKTDFAQGPIFLFGMSFKNAVTTGAIFTRTRVTIIGNSDDPLVSQMKELLIASPANESKYPVPSSDKSKIIIQVYEGVLRDERKDIIESPGATEALAVIKTWSCNLSGATNVAKAVSRC